MNPAPPANFWEHFANFTIRHARLILGIVLILSVTLTLGTKQIEAIR